MRTNINFISNIHKDNQGGGISNINYNIFRKIVARNEYIHYQFINPTVNFLESFFSKSLKILGFKRKYFYFSEKRLNNISKLYRHNENCIDLFIGFTPWIKITPINPYFCYNDCSFITYLNYYNDINQFQEKDIERIICLEKEWLCNAAGVFFQSDWALNETKRLYKLEGSNFFNVGVGGGIRIPESDQYIDGYNFLFISKEFEAKGGTQAFEVFKRVKEIYPSFIMNIIGESPPKEILNHDGVIYHGFLNKSKPEDLAKMEEVFSQAFLLIHPTYKDINPLVINELGYYGCPAISVKSFAIPEYVLDNYNGYLVDRPGDIDQMFNAITECINNPIEYAIKRKNARLYSTSKFDWDKIANNIYQKINELA